MRPSPSPLSRALFISLCLLGCPVMAQEQEQNPGILDKNIAELKFNQIAMKDCLDFLKDVSGASFEVDWKAFKAANVTEKTVITLHVKNEKLSGVLTRMFLAAGAKVNPELTAKEKTVSIKPGKKGAASRPARAQ